MLASRTAACDRTAFLAAKLPWLPQRVLGEWLAFQLQRARPASPLTFPSRRRAVVAANVLVDCPARQRGVGRRAAAALCQGKLEGARATGAACRRGVAAAPKKGRSRAGPSGGPPGTEATPRGVAGRAAACAANSATGWPEPSLAGLPARGAPESATAPAKSRAYAAAPKPNDASAGNGLRKTHA